MGLMLEGEDVPSLREIAVPMVTYADWDPLARLLYTTQGGMLFVTSLEDGQTRRLGFKAIIEQFVFVPQRRKLPSGFFPTIGMQQRSSGLLRVVYQDPGKYATLVAELQGPLPQVVACAALSPQASKIVLGTEYLAVFSSLPAKDFPPVLTLYRSTPQGILFHRRVDSPEGSPVPLGWVGEGRFVVAHRSRQDRAGFPRLLVLEGQTGSLHPLELQRKATYYDFARRVAPGVVALGFQEQEADWLGLWRIRWSPEPGRVERIEQLGCFAGPAYPNTVALSPQGKRLVYATFHGLFLVELDTKKKILMVPFRYVETPQEKQISDRYGPLAVAMIAMQEHFIFCRFLDESRLVCVRQDGQVELWDVLRRKRLKRIDSLHRKLKALLKQALSQPK